MAKQFHFYIHYVHHMEITPAYQRGTPAGIRNSITPYDQSHKNSPKSVSCKEVETALSINLQSARNDTAYEAIRGVRFNNDMGNIVVKRDGLMRLFMIGSRAKDDEKKHKLLELFPLRPEEDEKKHQLLELFPLRPNGNLRSRSNSYKTPSSFASHVGQQYWEEKW
jgi:hypothetical protein